jgi:hypothetical protein
MTSLLKLLSTLTGTGTLALLTLLYIILIDITTADCNSSDERDDAKLSVQLPVCTATVHSRFAIYSTYLKRIKGQIMVWVQNLKAQKVIIIYVYSINDYTISYHC